MSTKTKTETILVIMNVLTWIIFIGLMIEAGAILVSYGVSIINPKMVIKMYKGFDFYSLSQYDFWHYTGIISFKAAILIIEAYTAYLVIKVLPLSKAISIVHCKTRSQPTPASAYRQSFQAFGPHPW